MKYIYYSLPALLQEHGVPLDERDNFYQYAEGKGINLDLMKRMSRPGYKKVFMEVRAWVERQKRGTYK